MPYERFNKPSNATLIEDLDAPQRSFQQPQYQQPATDKYIRSSHQSPVESGMNTYNQHTTENFALYEQPIAPQQMTSVPVMSNMSSIPGPTCPEIYMHIMNCPVCRRMYGQETRPNMIYICIIFILLVFCALLFKKAFP